VEKSKISGISASDNNPGADKPLGPLAHSAAAGGEPHSYASHINAVRNGAVEKAVAMLRFVSDPERRKRLPQTIEAAAIFHDLGKLDEDNQKALRRGRSAKLPAGQIDAGVGELRRAT